MFRKLVSIFAGVAVAAFGTVACDGGTSPDGQSTLSVQLTDQPAADLSEAWVEITRIVLQGTAGGFTLYDGPPVQLDLLELGSETEDLVVNKTIPSGAYAQLWLYVGAAHAVTTTGEVYSTDGSVPPTRSGQPDGVLECPSCGETGIKVNLPEGGLQLQNESKILMLDFDAAESYGRKAGESGVWVLDPLITSSELEASGSVEGSVSADVSIPDCGSLTGSVEHFVPELLDGTTVVASGDVGSSGSYLINFLEPKTYGADFAVTVDASDTQQYRFDAMASPTSVSVESGTTHTVDYTITAASCEMK